MAKTPLKAPPGANYSGAVKVLPSWSNYTEVLVRTIDTGHTGDIATTVLLPLCVDRCHGRYAYANMCADMCADLCTVMCAQSCVQFCVYKA